MLDIVLVGFACGNRSATALGPWFAAVVISEMLLKALAMFNHSNVRLPVHVDRLLHWIVVTPDMHRVHHPVTRLETNNNFGFNLPWWDFFLGTYYSQAGAGHDQMTIGLPWLQDERQAGYLRCWRSRFIVEAERIPTMTHEARKQIRITGADRRCPVAHLLTSIFAGST